MKRIVICLIVTLLPLIAGGQNVRIKTDQKSIPLSMLISEIERQTDCSFICDEGMVNLNDVVDLPVKSGSVMQVLSGSLGRGSGYAFKINGSSISLFREQKAETKAVGVSGTVSDTNGDPVVGAFVYCPETKDGVSTDINGNFYLGKVSEGNTITVSCIGYRDETIVVGRSSVITVTLSDNLQELEATVVVGYGLQKKINLSGAVAVRDMKDIENRPMTQASEALYGVPGIYVNQSSSKPGSDAAKILVRGTGTLEGGASPLVLVDGIEYTLEDLNPDDIESISVLKDASASIYGSKAANGVILVTTKKATKGFFDVRFKANSGIQQAICLPDMVSDPIQYMEMYDQAQINCGLQSVTYSEKQISDYRKGLQENPKAFPATNWAEEVFKLGVLQEYGVGVSGGYDAVTYGINLGYMTQKGVLAASDDAARYSIDMKFDAKVSERLKIGANFNGNIRTNTDPVYGVTDIMNGYNRSSPLVGTIDEEGRYLNSIYPIPGQNVFYNSLMILNSGSINRIYQKCLVKLSADYTLPLNIVWKNAFAVDSFDGFIKVHKLPMNTYNPQTYDRQPYSDYYYVQQNDYNNLNLTMFSTLNWNHKFTSGHDLGIMAGYEWKSNDAKNMSARMINYYSEEVSELSAGGEMNHIGGTSGAERIASFFSRINYNYQEKYIAELIVRADGSSKFSKKNRWGFFPAASIAWRLDKENFLRNSSVDLLKLRLSFGSLGNQSIGNYKYFTLISVADGYNYSFNGTTVPGAGIAQYVDPDITWETTTSLNFGTDFAAFGNRLTAGFDVYRKVSSNVLRTVSIPSQIGMSGPVKNVGKVGNYGIETSLGYRNNVGNFSYGISGTFSYNINKVLELSEELKGDFQITKEGLPINSWYLYQADGYFPTEDFEYIGDKLTYVGEYPIIESQRNVIRPGYIRYRDTNGDGQVNDADRTFSGKTEPSIIYGFNINLGWKGIDLTATFQGVGGVEIYLDGNAATPFYNGAGVTKEWATDAWTPENQNSRLPILHTLNDAKYMHDYKNTQWLYDASYLRLKQLQLAYSFPKAMIAKARIKRLQVFVNANNLFTITENTLFDPEMATTQANLAQYPSLRTFNGGVNITF